MIANYYRLMNEVSMYEDLTDAEKRMIEDYRNLLCANIHHSLFVVNANTNNAKFNKIRDHFRRIRDDRNFWLNAFRMRYDIADVIRQS